MQTSYDWIHHDKERRLVKIWLDNKSKYTYDIEDMKLTSDIDNWLDTIPFSKYVRYETARCEDGLIIALIVRWFIKRKYKIESIDPAFNFVSIKETL